MNSAMAGLASNCSNYRSRYVPAYAIAMACAGMNDKNQVFKWLERACDDREFGITQLKVEGVFDDLRSDPRL